jgi:hypothetical protein
MNSAVSTAAEKSAKMTGARAKVRQVVAAAPSLKSNGVLKCKVIERSRVNSYAAHSNSRLSATPIEVALSAA